MTSDESLWEFCENVRKLREKSGLNKTQFAKLIKIGTKRLSKIENEHEIGDITMETVELLAKQFHLSIHGLFSAMELPK